MRDAILMIHKVSDHKSRKDRRLTRRAVVDLVTLAVVAFHEAVVALPVPGAILATHPRRVSATLVVPHGPAASWHQTNSPWSIG